jgi:5-methylcytosine-specific restriction endonuclease McrBC regulatory subunit McrC
VVTSAEQGWKLDQQDHLSFGSRDRAQFRADLAIRDSVTDEPLIVLDTKYKRHARPAADDLAQVVAYATAWGTTDAV